MSDREHDDSTVEEGRRSFLRRSGAAMVGLGLGARGLGRAQGQTGQEGDGQDGAGQGDDGPTGGIDNIQILLPNDQPLRRDAFRDVILFTEPTTVPLNAEDVDECGDLLPSPPFNGYQGLVVDRAELEQVFENGDLTKLGPLSETDAFVSKGVDVQVGTPYIITNVNYCEGDYLTVTAHPLPHPLRGGTDEGDGGFFF